MTEEYGIPANTLDPSISWKDVYWLQSITRLPIIIKGILTKEDAELAVEHGVQGIIVSNHGGRQLDGGPASVSTESFMTNGRAGHFSARRASNSSSSLASRLMRCQRSWTRCKAGSRSIWTGGSGQGVMY